MSDWPGHCHVPISPNASLTPVLEWKVTDDNAVMSFRLRDAFGSLLFSLSVPWPFSEDVTLDGAGQLTTRLP